MDISLLETAYIEILDSRGPQTSSITTASTKSILSGLSKSREKTYQESKKLKVQFNPAELSFSSGAAKVKEEKASLARKESGDVPHATSEKPTDGIEVQIKLIFDRSNYIDSSVQPEVEGFLTLVKNPYIRQVAFYWGEQYYRGNLKNVSAEYTMFNTLGIPMRANVGLSIELD